MKNGRRIMFLATFTLALGAGLAAGVLASRLPGTATIPTNARSPLAEQLQLTPEQSERMKVIWEGTRDSLDDCFTRGQSLLQERDDAVVSLLTPEQRAKYAKINESYVEHFAELTSRRQAAFEAAVARTEKMLSESQKKKYKEILRSRVGHDNPFGTPARAGSGESEGGPASIPTGPSSLQ